MRAVVVELTKLHSQVVGSVLQDLPSDSIIIQWYEEYLQHHNTSMMLQSPVAAKNLQLSQHQPTNHNPNTNALAAAFITPVKPASIQDSTSVSSLLTSSTYKPLNTTYSQIPPTTIIPANVTTLPVYSDLEYYTVNTTSIPIGLSDADLHMYVSIIYNRVRTTQLTQIALEELHVITIVYPYYDIFVHLEKSSPMFTSYVKKRLGELKAKYDKQA